MNKVARGYIGVFALAFAIVLLVLSLKTFDMDIDPVYEMDAEYEVYGGDAYTGIQNAVVDSARASATTARRIGKVQNTVSYVGGGLLLASSFAFFLVSVWGLFGGIGEDAKKSAPIYVPARPQAATPPLPKKFTPPAVMGDAVNMAADTQVTEDDSFWICTGCKTKNLKTRDNCWSCGKSNSVDTDVKN